MIKKISRQSKRHSARGFSLTEVLIVVLILAIITTFTLVQITQARASFQFSNAVRTLQSYLEKGIFDARRRNAKGDVRARIQVISTGSYQVTATSSNAASNRFRLASGTNFLRYTVRWNDGVSGLTSVTTGAPLQNLVGDSSSPDCSGSKPASVEVRIPNAAIIAAPIGNYADTLTIMITPQ